MPGPCARCGCAEGVALYATSRVRYFGCVSCRHLNVVPAFDQAPVGQPAAAAAMLDVGGDEDLTRGRRYGTVSVLRSTDFC